MIRLLNIVRPLSYMVKQYVAEPIAVSLKY